MATIIVGAQWGDEGKGKIIDFLAKDYDVVVRYNGGNNAGHTIYVNGKKIILHHLPSGVIYQEKINVMGNGMVVDPELLKEEIDLLERSGFDIHGRLFISERAHVIQQKHKEFEQDSGLAKRIGTTGRGIGPSYADKVYRTGLRVADVLHLHHFLKPYVTDTSLLVNDLIESGKRVLFEGAQGTMLDVDHGSYPYVTASNPTAGGAIIGSGIGPTKIKEVIGIAKAYTTRVGEGPFPTELGNYEEVKKENAEITEEEIEQAHRGGEYLQGKLMRIKGSEYGATTGRPRRCGWLDLVILKHAKRVNGLTSIAITKLDVLSGFSEIKVCTAYDVEGKITHHMPAHLEKAKPVYVTLPGWKEEITHVKHYSQLPEEARNYLNFIEANVGVLIEIISVGPEREQTIIAEKLADMEMLLED